MGDGFLFQSAEKSEKQPPDLFGLSQDNLFREESHSRSKNNLGFQFCDRT